MSSAASDVRLGENVSVHETANLYGCIVGDNTRVGAYVEIQRGAVVGRNCKISSHTFICEGVVIEEEVFVGHNVTFVNDMYPRATKNGALRGRDDWVCIPTRVRRGASLGSSATILAGVTIGEGAMVGAGSVVTRDVPPWTIVVGNPAHVLRSLPAGDAS